MNYSTPRWFAIVLVDFLLKFVLISAVGLFVTYGLISVAMLVMAAIAFSLLHFVCLFVGATLVVTPELFGARLPPRLRSAASVMVANMLFIAVVVVMEWPRPNDIPRTADGPISVALALATTNLLAFFTVAVVSRLFGCIKSRHAPVSRGQ